MNSREIIVVIVMTGIAALAVLFAVWCWWREKKTLQKMDRMLDEAIAGQFREQDFDESMLSSVESKLAHYLSASVVSEQNLKQEKDKIKTFISDISHQTKTPLSNILLYTQLLEEQELTAQGEACAKALEEQAKKLQILIESLVKLSRLETGILTLHQQAASIMPILQAAVGQLMPMAEEKGIHLILEPTQEEAVFDAKWTEEAVCNLLHNAMKYTQNGGRVSVRVIPYELFCRIDVSDNGRGISKEEQTKIFGRFYRAKGTETEEGVGIGLYLVRQIASGQGGYVKVDSEEGKGSTFSLFLPRT